MAIPNEAYKALEEIVGPDIYFGRPGIMRYIYLPADRDGYPPGSILRSLHPQTGGSSAAREY